MAKHPLNLAHRGFSAAVPENTLLAFEAARQAGANGIEFDVQCSRDGQLVVIHDETLNRTTDGTGMVKDYPYSELCQMDAGSWFGKEFSSERIPLLSEVLEWGRSRHVLLNLELKTSQVAYPKIEEKVISLLNSFKLKNQVIISSFNHDSLRKVKQIDPSFQIGLLYENRMIEPWHYAKRMNAAAIHPHFSHVMPEVINGCKKNKIQINTYTVNEVEDLKRMIGLGVHAIITNHPDRLKQLLG